MTTIIRAFNDQGLEQFKSYLKVIQNDPNENIPNELATDPQLSSPIADNIEIEARYFGSKLEAAQYLLPKIEELDLADRFYNSGLWAWLSAFYFDSVCPAEADGRRIPGSIYR